jgi:hypothetical protein
MKLGVRGVTALKCADHFLETAGLITHEAYCGREAEGAIETCNATQRDPKVAGSAVFAIQHGGCPQALISAGALRSSTPVAARGGVTNSERWASPLHQTLGLCFELHSMSISFFLFVCLCGKLLLVLSSEVILGFGHRGPYGPYFSVSRLPTDSLSVTFMIVTRQVPLCYKPEGMYVWIWGIFRGVKSGRRFGLTTLPPSMSRIS